jgi:hypothetical protein
MRSPFSSPEFLFRFRRRQILRNGLREAIQREVKRKWWEKHGKEWRDKKNKPKRKGGEHGDHKTR